MLLFVATQALALSVPTTSSSCSALLPSLFGGASIDADAIAAACSANIVWEDMNLADPLAGPSAVREHLAGKFPDGSKLVLDRVSDGAASGGFTWHRESTEEPGRVGLRGTLYAELDESGKLSYVREGCEPMFKPGAAIEALLNTATQIAGKPERPPATFTQATPTTANAIVRYLWEEAYPKGASPAEALRLMKDSILYEDFNYNDPLVGMQQVTDFVNAFDIPGVDFVPLKISEGERSVCFTWKVVVNGQDGPSGISFYEIDPSEGKICYIRDIPAPSIKPPPLGTLAAEVDPKLRVFSSEKVAAFVKAKVDAMKAAMDES